MTARRADAVAMAAICVAAIVVTWPLLANPNHVWRNDEHLDIDGLCFYGYAGAARTTALRFGQFPLRSPWHGGGYPLYAYPEDMTLTPTMLLVLAAGPWAALKIDFVLTCMAAGVGMFLLTRRKMGYPLAAAVFSATAFALGGYLMARWMRGWREYTHAVWLPLILYALWRGRCWRTAAPAVPLPPDHSLARQPRLRFFGSRGRLPHTPCKGCHRLWLAVAALLVAWLFLDSKYVPLVMGWFLLLLGLLRLDETEKGSDPFDGGGQTPSLRPAWGYFGRLALVWTFGAGLAAVKLLPMWPLLKAHLATPERPPEGFDPSWGVLGRHHDPWQGLALWLVVFAALGLTPLLVRLVLAHGHTGGSSRRGKPRAKATSPADVGQPSSASVLRQPGAAAPHSLRGVRRWRPRLMGIGGMAVALSAVVLAVALWAPRRAYRSPPADEFVKRMIDSHVSFGYWRVMASGERLPGAAGKYRRRASEGLPVLLLALAAMVFRPRTTWKWAILAGLLLAFQFSPVLPRDLWEAFRSLPVLSWIRKPWLHLNFCLFFVLTLLAGRALDWGVWVRRTRTRRLAAQVLSWGLVLGNVVYVGRQTRVRLAYTVREEPPAAQAWSDEYRLLDRPRHRWQDHVCFLLRGNIGLKGWHLDFRDSRREYLVPSLLASEDGAIVENPEFPGLAVFDDPANAVRLVEFTPNRIVAHVTVRQPGRLTINQISDVDWRTDEGVLVPTAPRLSVDLTRLGEYDVRLRYVPSLLYVGLVFTILTAFGGCLLLVFASRRGKHATG